VSEQSSGTLFYYYFKFPVTFSEICGSIKFSMSSLYRIYRPATFTDVIGQDHITSSLQNSLKKNLVGHAYLFSGPRGTGKTTLARLFAKAVNCQKKDKNGNPCNECEICQEIIRGQATDIIEIDAASNRGIDEMRELREKIGFAPSRTSYKVYIIDEVHMLTKEAFNALLKTLEEPPKHALFILATTELHKVPDTIISRCQRHQFHRASNEKIVTLLKEVSKKEKISIDDEGLQVIAARAEGSFRDSLTLLGNIATQEKPLSGKELRELMGMPAEETVKAVVHELLSGDEKGLIAFLRRFIDDGGDLTVLVKHVCDMCKDAIFNSNETMSRSAASNLLEQLLIALARARNSSDATGVLVSRLMLLCAAVPKKEVVSPIAAPAVTDIQKKPEKEPVVEEPAPVDTVSAPQGPPAASDQEFWQRFLEQIKESNHALYMLLRSAHFEGLTDEKLVLAVKFRFYSERLFETKNRKIIENSATAIAGRQLVLECEVRSDLSEPSRGEASSELLEAVVDVFELEETG
jgi:DNA polymerase-3 subunit gamma/tau